MEYTQLSLTLEEYQQSKEEIKKELGGIVKGFVRTGWHLSRIDASGAYKMDGYKSIAEFAKAEYNMTPSGVTRFIEVYNQYSVPGDTPELQERYRTYNFSQLQEMLQLPMEDRDMILPEAKREDIRELKRYNKENEHNPEVLETWQEERKEDKILLFIEDYFRANKELTNTLFDSPAWEKGDTKELVEILNPSGNASFRKGMFFMMMYSESQGIKIKDFTTGLRSVSWPEFFDVVRAIFGEDIDGKRTYQKHFGGTEDEERRGSEPHKTGSAGITDTAGSGAGAPEKKGSIPSGAGKPAGRKERPTDPERTAGEKKSEPARKSGEDSGKETGDEPQPEAKPAEAEEKPVPAEQESPEPAMPEQEIAPAQEKPVIPEPEHVEGEVISDERVPVGSRWEFLKNQNEGMAALYFATIVSEFPYRQISDSRWWDTYLRTLVDEEGESIE